MRDPTRQRSFIAGYRQNPVRLHRHAGEALAHHRHVSDQVSAFERAFVISVARLEADVRPVLGKQERRIRLECLGWGHHHRQRFDVEKDGFGRVHRLSLRLRDDGGADVADEPDPVGAEHRAIERGRHHREHLHRRQPEVVAGVEDGSNSWHRLGVRHVDPVQHAVGDHRAHECEVQHARLDEVVQVLAGAREERRILQAEHRVAEDRTG